MFMDLSSWFSEQLENSTRVFLWALEELPEERRFLTPPNRPAEWSTARHAFHLLYYEREFALPSMRQWLGGSMPSLEALDEDAAWEGNQSLARILEAFRAVRAEQVALLPRFDAALWEEQRKTAFWGTVSLRWVVTKSYQHTAEHIHDVLRIALFWEWSARQAQGQA
jgi:hypothetical protein